MRNFLLTSNEKMIARRHANATRGARTLDVPTRPKSTGAGFVGRPSNRVTARAPVTARVMSTEEGQSTPGMKYILANGLVDYYEVGRGFVALVISLLVIPAPATPTLLA